MTSCIDIICLCFGVCFINVNGNQVSMKFVEEPSSYSLNNQFLNEVKGIDFKMRVLPGNFSGPRQFQSLVGKCFNKTINQYKYEFCPFQNVTQYEQSLRWNPYSGILGIWQEWEIQNNTFHAMLMKEGDSCGGSMYRMVRVLFHCGKNNEIIDVTEPQKCQYDLTFQTPLTCHSDAMLVYPRLTEELQKHWDDLEGQLAREEITHKGYHNGLHQILTSAGYFSIPEIVDIKTENSVQFPKIQNSSAGNFQTLDQCSQEYQRLKRELDGIRMLLSLSERQRVDSLLKS